MTGLSGQEPEQNCQDSAASTGLQEYKKTREEQKGEDSQKKARHTRQRGQPERGSHDGIGRARLPGQNYQKQDCQHRTGNTGLLK
jgi:hypothetical protein